MSPSRPTVSPVSLPDFAPASGGGTPRELETLADLTLTVSVVAGTARLSLGELDALRPGSMVLLDRSPEASADVFVNGVRAGCADVVVLDEHLAARIAELAAPERP